MRFVQVVVQQHNAVSEFAEPELLARKPFWRSGWLTDIEAAQTVPKDARVTVVMVESLLAKLW